MAVRWMLLGVALTLVMPSWSATKAKQAEPRLLAIHPFTGTIGHTYKAVISGTGIQDARLVQFSNPHISARVLGSTTEVPKPGKAASQPPVPTVLIEIEVQVEPDVKPGEQPFRLVTSRGISNELYLQTVHEPVISEEAAPKPLRAFPVALTGVIANPGENDSYWIDVQAGQTLTFDAVSGHPQFDPSLSIYEPSGSWFDPNRLNRVAFNDEPLHFPGLSANPRLVYRFTKPGSYCVKVSAFSGQGGPAYVYGLYIRPGSAAPLPLHPQLKTAWNERQFTRKVSSQWLRQVSQRSGRKAEPPASELYSAAPATSQAIPIMSAPGIVEGRLTRASEVQAIRLRVEAPQDLAFEIETPEATMPRFNPVVRILDSTGAEIITNVHTKLNNNGLYMMKMIQAKMTLSFRNAGEFTIQIRDITTDCAGDDFAYRVLVRPQIPHLGHIQVAEDTISISSGSSQALNLTLELEEDFSAPVTFSVEGLPAGLSAMPAISSAEEKPILANSGKMERYTPKTRKAVVLVTASPGAPVTSAPVNVRLMAHPFVEGTIGAPILVKSIPLLVSGSEL